MKRDFKTGILLMAIGFTATIGLVVITGKHAIASNEIPNPAYSLGFCVYKTGGDIGSCYQSVKRLHTDMEYRRCVQDTPYPTACLASNEVTES